MDSEPVFYPQLPICVCVPCSPARFPLSAFLTTSGALHARQKKANIFTLIRFDSRPPPAPLLPSTFHFSSSVIRGHFGLIRLSLPLERRVPVDQWRCHLTTRRAPNGLLAFCLASLQNSTTPDSLVGLPWITLDLVGLPWTRLERLPAAQNLIRGELPTNFHGPQPAGKKS